MVEFCKNYLAKYPDAKLSNPEFYTHHPALNGGENVLCILDSEQYIIGFAPLFPILTTNENLVTGPHDIWMIILADPETEIAEDVRDLLLKGVIERINEYKSIYGLSQIRLAADMMESQEADIDYLQRKGFVSFEQMYVLNWHDSQVIPTISVPNGITLREMKFASKEEQMAYLEVHDAFISKNPKAVEELQFLLQSPLWETGTAIAAYSPADELVGSVLLYWDEQKGYGVTDDVMVLPDWRGQNIAKRLIGEGLSHFQAKGISEVRLEALVNNVPAVSVPVNGV